MKAISYARVSTTVQGESGLGLDDQLAKCQDYAARNGLEVLDHVVEVESAKSVAGRPLLTSTLERLRRGEADTLIVAKLDRLSRSVLDLCQLMEKADREGWTLVVIDLGVDSSPSGRLQAHVVGAFAEYERRLIGQRTRDAMSAAKARGVHCGRTSSLSSDIVERVVAERLSGLTWQGIADGLNSEGVPTSQGKTWRVGTVQGVYNSTRGVAFRQARETLEAVA